MVVGYRSILNAFSCNCSKTGLRSLSFLAICLLAKANHIPKSFVFPEIYQEGEISLNTIMLAIGGENWVMLGIDSDICGMLVIVFCKLLILDGRDSRYDDPTGDKIGLVARATILRYLPMINSTASNTLPFSQSTISYLYLISAPSYRNEPADHLSEHVSEDEVNTLLIAARLPKAKKVISPKVTVQSSRLRTRLASCHG